MWDDPLFNHNHAPAEEWELNDPEFIKIRRKTRLLELELLYIKIDRLQKQFKEMYEAAGWYAWGLQYTLQQISQNIPLQSRKQWRELLEQMKIDTDVQRILGMDFAAWLDVWLQKKSQTEQT